MISVVVPCFNEEESIPLFYKEMEKTRKKMNKHFEYIFINDGSSDNTLAVLKELNQKDENAHYLSFSRNFGKEAALYAGLKHSTGEYITVMDADLQDPPELLPEMLNILKTEDYDCVGTRRKDRKGEPPVRSFFSKSFYFLINKISQTEMIDGVRDYRLMTRQMVDAILEISEYNRFSKGIFSWVGFKTKYLSFENKERIAGNTSWSFWSLFKYSIEGIINFSEAPLMIASFVGFLFFVIAIIMLLFIVGRTLIYGNPTSGWPSMISIILLASGLQLFCLGIVGKYIGKIFLETKDRPIYILKETDKKIKKSKFI